MTSEPKNSAELTPDSRLSLVEQALGGDTRGLFTTKTDPPVMVLITREDGDRGDYCVGCTIAGKGVLTFTLCAEDNKGTILITSQYKECEDFTPDQIISALRMANKMDPTERDVLLDGLDELSFIFHDVWFSIENDRVSPAKALLDSLEKPVFIEPTELLEAELFETLDQVRICATKGITELVGKNLYILIDLLPNKENEELLRFSLHVSLYFPDKPEGDDVGDFVDLSKYAVRVVDEEHNSLLLQEGALTQCLECSVIKGRNYSFLITHITE